MLFIKKLVRCFDDHCVLDTNLEANTLQQIDASNTNRTMFLKYCLAICCFVIFKINAAQSEPIQPRLAISSAINESQQLELSNFWSSIHKIGSVRSDAWNRIADNILAIVREFNSTLDHHETECYQAIENTFRRGLQSGWSAKCKCILFGKAFLIKMKIK